jgi:hypothetical protein
MESIIKKWGNPKSPDNYIFPFLKGGEDAEQQVKVANDIIRRKSWPCQSKNHRKLPGIF